MRYCTNCGEKINPDSKYCSKCGKPINDEKSEYNESPINDEKSEYNESPINDEKSENNKYPLNNEEEESIWQSTIKFLRELVQILIEAGTDIQGTINEIINTIPDKPKDSKCPYCGSEDTYSIIKNEVEVKTKGYSWGTGCCGICLLGPFGLLCGLCGSGSKVNSKSIAWWGCKNCGKQYLAQHDAVEMLSSFMDKLVVNCLCYGAIGSLLIYPILEEFIHGILLTILVVIVAVVVGITAPLFLVYQVFNSTSEQLGYDVSEILEVEKKKEYWNSIKISMISLGMTLVLVFPILRFFAE